MACAPACARKRPRKHLDSGYVHVYEHEHVHVQASVFHSLRYTPPCGDSSWIENGGERGIPRIVCSAVRPHRFESPARDLLDPSGGERGIRTPDTAFGPYNDLANRRLQPLGHLSAAGIFRTTTLLLGASSINGALWRIRTTGLLIRSQMLYPAELRARTRGIKVPNLETFSREGELKVGV